MARSSVRGSKIARVLIAGNWKMFKGAHQAREFAAQIRHLSEHAPGVDVVVCPPFVSLEATLQGLGADSGVRVYGQNVHWELEGAFTGEVSPPMLLELGVVGRDHRALRAPPALLRDG